LIITFSAPKSKHEFAKQGVLKRKSPCNEEKPLAFSGAGFIIEITSRTFIDNDATSHLKKKIKWGRKCGEGGFTTKYFFEIACNNR
ncbi:MAG: hypothetical protein ACQEQN_01720, partial [Thermodesulfobacteriota bacterium]